MIRRYLLLFALVGLLGVGNSHVSEAARTERPTRIEVFFSPGGGCTDAIVKALKRAKTSVLIQAYYFTSAPIAKAVVDAHKRGVETKVILDKSQATASYSSADFLAHSGVTVLIDAEHNIAHNKVMIIDSSRVITGSFNFTKTAEEENAENLLIIHSADLAAKYIRNWNIHSRHSKPYSGR